MSIGSVWSETSGKKLDNSYEQRYRPLRLPNFYDNSGRLNPDHWDDILLRMERENRDAIEKEYANYRIFIVPETVQLVFTICVRLELPHEIRYLALLIYDEFMRLQITRLYDQILASPDDEAVKYEFWSNALLRFYSQATLRAVSCISISIKCCYYRLTLCSNMLKRVLVAMNHMYDEASILKSETRVFSTIMFSVCINRNPVLIMETFICILLHKYPELQPELDPEPLWEHAVLFMDIIYLNMKDIYRRLWAVIHDESAYNGNVSIERERTWHLEADFISLSLAVIAIGTYSLHGDELMSKVITALSIITRVDSNEILVFARVIWDFTMDMEPEPPVPALPSDLIGMKHVNNAEDSFDFFE